MRNTLLYIFAIVAISFGACDVIDGPFLEETETGGEVVENPQKVLIMDYTGHTCKSCPKAHQTIHMIKQVYGDKAIGVAFHLGYFAKPKDDGKYNTDFRTPEGDVLENYYDFVSFPIGWVNRMGKEDLIPYPSWAAETKVYVQQSAKIILTARGVFDPLTQMASAVINLKDNGLTSKTGVKLAIYLTESNIISYQKNEDASPIDVSNYIHNHVFRDAYGTIWGEEVDFTACDGDGLDFVRKIEISQDWVPENCSFVIIAYDSETMEVIQVEEADIE